MLSSTKYLVRESTPQLYWSVTGDSLENDIKYWCDYTGQRVEQIKDWGWLKAVHPDDREKAREKWEQAVKKQHVFRTEYRVCRHDGLYQKWFLKYVPLFGKNSQLSGWVSWRGEETNSPDGSWEADTWKRHFLHSLLFEPAFVGGAWLDLDSRLHQVNDYFCEIYGYERTELLGRRFCDFLDPEEVDTYHSFLRQMFKHRSQISSTMLRGRNKNQEIIWLNPTFLLVYGSMKEPKHFLLLVDDITAQKRAEEEERQRLIAQEQASREAEQKALQEKQTIGKLMEAVFSSMVEGVLVIDENEIVMQMNGPARDILELPVECECVGQALSTVLQRYYARVEGDEQELLPLSEYCIGKKDTVEHGEILEVNLSSGREKILSLTSTGVSNVSGQAIGRVTVFRDVTQRQRKEKRVLQALNSLLSLVEELASISVNYDPFHRTRNDTLGEHLAGLIAGALDCQYVSVVKIEQPNERLFLVGTTGLSPEQRQSYEEEINCSVVDDYLDAEEKKRLYANKIVVRDLTEHPYQEKRQDFGIRRRLYVPMLLGKDLVGVFVLARHATDSSYTEQEGAFILAVARLTAFFLERVRMEAGTSHPR